MATNMRVGLIIVFAALTQWGCTESQTASISGSVSDDVTFLHKMFPVPPSSNMIVEMDISYPEIYDSPMIKLHTTEDHFDIRTQCIPGQYGQLREYGLHPGLIMGKSLSGRLRCELCFVQNTRMLHCRGDIIVQYYRPRHIYFSLGYHCNHIPSNSSLKGLDYKVTFSRTNDIVCTPFLSDDMQLRWLPNFRLLKLTASFYQHKETFLCYTFVLNRIEISGVYSPWIDLSYHYFNGCGQRQGNLKFLSPPSLNKNLLCFYEPTGYRDPPLTVDHAMISTAYTMTNKYLLHGKAEYTSNERFKIEGNKTMTCMYIEGWSTPSCDTGFQPHSRKIILSNTTTLITEPTGISTTQFLVVVLLLILLVMLFFILAVRYRTKYKRARQLGKNVLFHTGLNETDNPFTQEGRRDPGAYFDTASPLKRRRPFDATIFYHFDTDDDFVVDHLLPELEKARDFKLFIHSRNFTPGRDIKDNIEEAIEGSNSAILLMSQGFVDSMWCKEEFTHCYIENMKDAAFNLFVIMMQPADTLVNISPYMKTFFTNKTYLDANDPELFPRLASYLENARFSENDNSNGLDENDESDDE